MWRLWARESGAERIASDHARVGLGHLGVGGHKAQKYILRLLHAEAAERLADRSCAGANGAIKDQCLARFYSLGKPFALLMPGSVFDSAERRDLMRRHGVQLLLPNGRIHFETPNHAKRAEEGKKSSSWFYSLWVCWQLNLPSDITFA